MLDPQMQEALNKQFAWEQAASQEYLAIAAYFERLSLRGFAKFMRKQSGEERGHAMRIFDHICDRGGRVRVQALAEPKGDFDSPRAGFEAAWAREQSNTRAIHELYRLADQSNDYATKTMLHWFIQEQVEEEQWCQEALDLFKVAGDDRSALLMLDARYGGKAGEE